MSEDEAAEERVECSGDSEEQEEGTVTFVMMWIFCFPDMIYCFSFLRTYLYDS